MNSDDISLSPERTSALTTIVDRLGDHLSCRDIFRQPAQEWCTTRFLDNSLSFTRFFFGSDSPGRRGNAVDAGLERCNGQCQNTTNVPTIFRVLVHESGIKVRGGLLSQKRRLNVACEERCPCGLTTTAWYLHLTSAGVSLLPLST